jgi:anti-sigma28 factor (negative regulator of flagellin synthesis)
MTPSDTQRTRENDDSLQVEAQRLEALKELVRRRAYSVPSEDVAARIIGHAFGVAAPAGHGHS